ncbi:MAG: diguanylate cyclase, partial [Nitrososphaerota archaeon]
MIKTDKEMRVIKTLAERLKEYFGKEGIICRSAGDEFSVVVEIEKKEDVIKILEDIKEIFKKPIHI